MKPRLKKSTVIPIALLFYLAFMSWVGRDYFLAGDYLFYFGVIGATILCIIALHFSLKRRERLAAERRKDLDSNQREA